MSLRQSPDCVYPAKTRGQLSAVEGFVLAAAVFSSDAASWDTSFSWESVILSLSSFLPFKKLLPAISLVYSISPVNGRLQCIIS